MKCYGLSPFLTPPQIYSRSIPDVSRSLTRGVTERCQVGDVISHCATHVTEVTTVVRLLFSRHLLSHPAQQKESIDKTQRRRRSRAFELFLRWSLISPVTSAKSQPRATDETKVSLLRKHIGEKVFNEADWLHFSVGVVALRVE